MEEDTKVIHDLGDSEIELPFNSIENEDITRKRSFDEFKIGSNFEENFDLNNTLEDSSEEDNDLAPPKKKQKKQPKNEKLISGQVFANEVEQNEQSIFNEKKEISLEDLISSIKPKKQKKNQILEIEKQTTTNKFEQLRVEENVSELKKLSYQQKTGINLVNPEDPLILKQKVREEALKMTEKRMEKNWDKIDQKIVSSRNLPIFYEDCGQKNNKNVLKSEISFIDEFNKKLSLNQMEVGQEDFQKLVEKDTLTKEELLKKTQELAGKRRQLSYNLAKNRRIKKIKSRSFRRKLRKQKEKQSEKSKQLLNLSEDEIKKDLEQQELEYIRERVTLRHKNTSKWIKRAITNKKIDPNLAKSIEEQVNLKQNLLNKQNFDEQDDVRILDELFSSNERRRKEILDELKGSSENKGGIYEMKFMKRAEAKKREERNKMIEEIDRITSTNDEVGKKKKQEVHGRKVFIPKKKIISKNIKPIEFEANSFEMENLPSNINKIVSIKDNIKVNYSNKNEHQPNVLFLSKPRKRKRKIQTKSNIENDINPWLSDSPYKYENEDINNEENEQKKRKKNFNIIEIEKSENLNDFPQIEQENMKYQQELKKEAFAGDDLELEFENEKESAIDKEINMPEFEPSNLPGWNSWVGKGIDVSLELKQKEEEINNIKKEIREERTMRRMDNDLKNVIIRKNAVPNPNYFYKPKFGNTSTKRKIYDNISSQPLGPEWNTIIGHKKVVVQRDFVPFRGKVIAPLSKENIKNIGAFNNV